MIWICNLCDEELPIGEEGSHSCFIGAQHLLQIGETNRLTLERKNCTEK